MQNSYMQPNFLMQNLQNIRDRADSQIRQIQQNQMFQPQPVPITQNFQITPTNNEIECKYVEDINEVKNTFVMKVGVFVNKDYSTMWVKDISGNIRIFKTDEVVIQDEKDIALKEKDNIISNLQNQINELRGVILNDRQSNDTESDASITTKKSKRVSNDKSNDV